MYCHVVYGYLTYADSTCIHLHPPPALTPLPAANWHPCHCTCYITCYVTQIPQLILPEPPISFTMPTPPKLGPEVRFEGSPNLIPNVSDNSSNMSHDMSHNILQLTCIMSLSALA
jgi:hypothetical protein